MWKLSLKFQLSIDNMSQLPINLLFIIFICNKYYAFTRPTRTHTTNDKWFICKCYFERYQSLTLFLMKLYNLNNDLNCKVNDIWYLFLTLMWNCPVRRVSCKFPLKIMFLLFVNRILTKCLILALGVPFNCSTMRPYKITSSELRTMVTSLCVLGVAFLLIMWIYHKLNTRQQEKLISCFLWNLITIKYFTVSWTKWLLRCIVDTNNGIFSMSFANFYGQVIHTSMHWSVFPWYQRCVFAVKWIFY